jgi:hypothetical protein
MFPVTIIHTAHALSPSEGVRLELVPDGSSPRQWENVAIFNHQALILSSVVGLPHSVGKLLEGEFHWLSTDWGFAICFAQVQ